MIEYVLIVIISVTMLFLAKGLFTNLNTYISGYVGGYFKCLMTHGELPVLGVLDGDLSKHTGGGYKCSASLQKSNIANQGDVGGGKQVGTTTQLSSSKAQGSTKETARSRTGISSRSSGSSKKMSNGNSRNNNSIDSDADATRFSSNIKNRSEAYSSSDGEGDESVRSVPMASRNLENENSERFRSVSARESDDLKNRTRGGSLSRRENISRKLSLTKDDDLRPGTRRSAFNFATRTVAVVSEEPEMEMGFGYFMKWIMIAGIGIVIFIFFGGQIMNYNNSDSD